MFRTKTVARLRQAMTKESDNMNPQLDNSYGVESKKYKVNNENLLCDLRSKLKNVKTLKKSEVFGPVVDAIPQQDLFSNTSSYNNCAIVTSAGSLFHSKLGKFIGIIKL